MAKPDLVMEERLELMVSTDGSNIDRYRKAHFLPPCVTSIDGPVSAPNLAPDSAPNDYKRLPLKPDFPGWTQPKDNNWKTWVNQMQSLHHTTWKAGGIHDAVINSTYNVQRDDDLIFGLVDKWWCPSTNTFVFPWGEATITLEDVMVIGGFSVLGDSVLSPPPGDEETVEKLVRARSSINKTSARKADRSKWMTMFMGSGSEIEHEAFLAYWLSRFVFPYWKKTIGTKVLPVAVRLAKGNKTALAPPVIASIYKNLTLLKEAIVAARKDGHVNVDVLKVTVTATLLLLQVWVWERFPSLRPNPVFITPDEPRLARWHNLKKLSGVGRNIDSAGDNFQWRPYTTTSLVYMQYENWVKVDSDLDEVLEEFVRCLRTSEVVGLEADCIEQYLPHRVARQFGMDQDLPGHVARVNVNPDIAWRDYCRPIRDVKLYVPPRAYEPRVTTRYLKWWKKLNSTTTKTEPGGHGVKDDNNNSLKVEVKAEEEFVPPPPGFLPMWGNAELVAEQVGQGQKSPLSSAADNGRTSSFKRKFVVSSSDDDSENNHSQGENDLSCAANNGNNQVADSEVNGKLKKEASKGVDNKDGASPSRVERSVSEAAGIGLEERIINLEKLCAFLKAR